LTQLNKVSHDIAVRVAKAIGLEAPAADDTYYHDNTTAGISIFSEKLPSIATLRVGVLASTSSDESLSQADALREAFAKDNVTVVTVAETLGERVDLTYSQAEAIGFDGIIVAEGTDSLFNTTTKSTLYPPRRPAQILADGYNWGKPVGFLGGADSVLNTINAAEGDGVYTVAGVDEIVEEFRDGLATFKFTDRFAIDE
jgi:catalase